MRTITKAPAYDADIPTEPVRLQLRRRLLALNYHAFAQCICHLLGKLGYEDVRLTGRTEWKGRNHAGGYDIEALLPAGIGRRRVIVQAKQYDTLPVFQRSVDEVRGTCLRAGASEAVLITTSAFSSAVRQKADDQSDQIAPVRLVGGETLLDLLVLHRIGVREAGMRRVTLDEVYFESLSHACTGSRPRTLPRPEDGRCWVVTIHVDRGNAAGGNITPRGNAAGGNIPAEGIRNR